MAEVTPDTRPRGKSFSKRFSHTIQRFRSSTKVGNESEEKFNDDIKQMKEYISFDVKSLDTKSFDEGKKIAESYDNTNRTFLRYCNQRLGSLSRRRQQNVLLKGSVTVGELPEPPNYVAQFELHRERNQAVNVRYYANCQKYLELNGYFVVDKTTILDATPEEVHINPSRIIEPYQVIFRAEELSKEKGDSIDTVLKKSLQKLVSGMKSMSDTISVSCPVPSTIVHSSYPAINPDMSGNPKSMWS